MALPIGTPWAMGHGQHQFAGVGRCDDQRSAQKSRVLRRQARSDVRARSHQWFAGPRCRRQSRYARLASAFVADATLPAATRVAQGLRRLPEPGVRDPRGRQSCGAELQRLSGIARPGASWTTAIDIDAGQLSRSRRAFPERTSPKRLYERGDMGPASPVDTQSEWWRGLVGAVVQSKPRTARYSVRQQPLGA